MGYNGAMAKEPTFSDQLREAIDTCGKSRYRLAQETGVSQAQLCRFMAGQGLGMANIDSLCRHLGLELRPRRKASRRKGK